MDGNRNSESFVTLEEAAKILGLVPATLYLYTHKRVIPYYKPNGRKVYFKIKDLTAFIEKGRKASIDEIKEQAVKDTLKI